ncbi:N-acetylmuramoyl-L-alanine amidase [Leisingera sp. NJS201]|uniref:N-acetylmuramoyl-L-alanine amidase n=1 Tax=Leisingera sp. NJS201 TaxID=2508306 RepID=UPI001070A3EA|nr:N-acetylmuramoyl-L-alanine amidase [Leisingera sp. NJS201]QBR36045.1 N-acetylmuramoyl-L-alanine amidase [Leisingera sp. NJS201]
MGFKDGILEGVDFETARWTGGAITPEIVILHDTASRLDKGNSARYLQYNNAKTSVHFVIERDGHVQQQVPVYNRANHAGTSQYHGRQGCNGFSIGIELVNPGKMQRHTLKLARAWYGETFDIATYGIQELETPEHGAGLWMPHTTEQLVALDVLLQKLFSSVCSLRDITTHWYVSPGRKVDTNPLFPLEHIRARVLGRDDPVETELAAQEIPARPEELVAIDVPGGSLNVRRWPSFNPNVIAQIPDGTVVPVLASGVFAGRTWLKVLYGGASGWVVKSYADPITFSKPGFKGAET